MVYSAQYTAADMSSALIDNIVGILAALFSFVTLIAVVLLYRWFRGRKVM